MLHDGHCTALSTSRTTLPNTADMQQQAAPWSRDTPSGHNLGTEVRIVLKNRSDQQHPGGINMHHATGQGTVCQEAGTVSDSSAQTPSTSCAGHGKRKDAELMPLAIAL